MRSEQTRRRRALASQQDTQNRAAPRTPEAVPGRRHMDVQTETFLEELTDRVPEETAGTQTEAFLDRPPTPLFMPAKTGVDRETQILPGELFDFDLEVEPILEVLVGKTLEQGLMEVLEEEELSAIRNRQEEFEQLRNSELAEVQRLEAEVKRKYAEKVRIEVILCRTVLLRTSIYFCGQAARAALRVQDQSLLCQPAWTNRPRALD